MYNIEEIVAKVGGKDYIKQLIEVEGYNQQEVLKVLGVVTSSRIVAKKFIDYCGAVIPYPKVSNTLSRKWMIKWGLIGGRYWEDDWLVEQTLEKLSNPIINIAGKSIRFNVSMWGHPSANKDSYQVRAHQVLWELVHECYLPEGSEIGMLDNDFSNLTSDNIYLRTTEERKSFYSTGERNHFYTGTPRYTNYTREWDRISKKYKSSTSKCEICSSEYNLNIHHIISYWLFDDNDIRVHDFNNLLTVCDSCHGKLHQRNTSIVPHISEMKYKNLLELLESLKSQVPDSLLETLRSVEKQLGLTDNQQPSI
jgi:hypothetical protein